MATASIFVFPSTPRLKPVALPDDLIEDQAYIANAMRSTDTTRSAHTTDTADPVDLGGVPANRETRVAPASQREHPPSEGTNHAL